VPAAALANAGELAYDQVIIVAGAGIFMEDVDVVVIGVGSAGLSAAKTLRGAMLQTCGGARLLGEAVARTVAAQLAAK
jgi:monoamine oxidase